jgi:metabotropic glutamate receptor 4/metabotropic glutamate receptor 6/7/8
LLFAVFLNLFHHFFWGSNLVLKEFRIWYLFRTAAKLQKSTLSTNVLLGVTGSIIAIELIVLIVWTSIDMPRSKTETDYTASTTSTFCSPTNVVFVWLLLGEKLLFLSGGLIMSLLTKDIPESYNESKYIAFSVSHHRVLEV